MSFFSDFINKFSGVGEYAHQRMLVSYASNTGKIRSRNEDNFYADSLGSRCSENIAGYKILDGSNRYVFAVCDGMGGEQFGDEASAIAVGTMKSFAKQLKKVSLDSLYGVVNEYASAANNQICRMTFEKQAKLSGSTLVMACTAGENAYIFNIGDSRAYYYSGGAITQITEDQTLAMKKLKANIYTEEEARLSPDAHRITSFLGADSRGVGLKALAYPPVNLETGAVLLCSDGLTDMCSDTEIAEVLGNYCEDCAGALVNKALQNGGADNVTCIVIKALFD